MNFENLLNICSMYALTTILAEDYSNRKQLKEKIVQIFNQIWTENSLPSVHVSMIRQTTTYLLLIQNGHNF